VDSETNKEFKRLSKLTAFEGKSDEFIEHEAKKNVVIRELIRNGNFLDDDTGEERKLAKSLFDKYLKNQDFETESDLTSLSVLVYNEVLVHRIQKSINAQKDSQGNFYLNDKLIKSLNETQDQIFKLKKELGFDKDKSENELSAYQQEQKKLDLHIAFNKNEYTIPCCNCGKMLLLRYKVKDFEAIKHPAFSGRWLCNFRMLIDVEKGILSKEQMAYYQDTSVDYIQWLLENKGKLIEIEGFTDEEINNFMKTKDYLKDYFIKK
jgi:hypothetical protein